MSQRGPSCVVCGGPRTGTRRVCLDCIRGVGRDRGDCASCGRPNQFLDATGRCRWCREWAARRCPDCRAEGTQLVSIDQVRVCPPCALRRDLDRVIPDRPAGALHPLRPVLLSAEPLSTRHWLTRCGRLLRSIDEGSLELDHAVLDTQPNPHRVEYLRALLISAGILPDDDLGPLRRFESAIPRLLDQLNDQHTAVVTRWTRWAVLPRLRAAYDRRVDLRSRVSNQRRVVIAVVAFLTTLEGRHRDLAHASQDDIDEWFRQRPGNRQLLVRPFLKWAQQHNELPRGLRLPPARRKAAPGPVDAEARWQIARRLLTDDTMDTADRVAGALLVLYAQPIAKIAKLSTHDVVCDGERVLLHLGPDPLELPEPIATQILKLPVRRREGAAEQVPTSWLFPSQHAGAHIQATNLGDRMRAIGISPRLMRRTAADQLAREVPPAMLAGILGTTPRTAAEWTGRTGGNWANYAADRART